MIDGDVHPGFADAMDLVNQFFHRLAQTRIARIGDAQSGGEISRSERDQVHSIQGRNGLDIVNTFQIFRHDDEQNFLIGRLHMFPPGNGPISRRPGAARRAAFAHRRIAHGCHGSLGALDTFNMGDLNALRPHVEHAQDRLGIVLRHTHDGGNAGEIGDADHLRDQAQVKAGVLHIDEHPVEAGQSDNFHDRRIGKSGMAHQS